MSKSNKMAKTTTIAIILLMASVALGAPSVQAQTATNMRDNGSLPLPAGVTPDEEYISIAHMSFRPNPVGVGQSILVNLWLQPPLHVVRLFKDAYIVTFTKPDGTVAKVGHIVLSGDATAWFEYTMDRSAHENTVDFTEPISRRKLHHTQSFQHGANVSFNQFTKPGVDGPYDSCTNRSSWAIASGTLPTDYWARPASPETEIGGRSQQLSRNRIVGGAWLAADTNTYMSNYLYIPYVQGPKSAHIVWKRQDNIGGLIGGTVGQASLSSSGGSPSIVYAGRAYQTLTKMVDGKATSVWQCYDLRTGEVYWEQVGVTQVPTMITYILRTSETVPGEEAQLSGLQVRLMFVGSGRLIYYDPWLGTSTMNISIAPLTTGTFYKMDSNGWPVFLAVQTLGSGANVQYRLINWTVIGDIAFGGATNLRLGVLGNVSNPFSSLGTVDYEAGIAVNTASITTPGTGGIGAGFVVAYAQRIMGVSITTGQLLFNTTTDVSTGVEGFFSGSTAVADHGKYAVRLNDGHWHCWDLRTGAELWTSELSGWWELSDATVYSHAAHIIPASMIVLLMIGILVRYPGSTRQSEYPYGNTLSRNYPWFTGTARIADGVLYTYNTEHSPSNPIQRGQKLHAINATTGEGIWNITWLHGSSAVADGYMTQSNSYDAYVRLR
jgi:hypothetical protein